MASEFFEARLLFIAGAKPAYYSSLAMKAIVVEEFGGPEVLRLVDVPDLVATGNRFSFEFTRGGQPCGHLHPRRHLCSQTAAALHPGSDGSGVVAAVGEEVESVAIGQRVFLRINVGDLCRTCRLRTGTGPRFARNRDILSGRRSRRALRDGVSSLV